jgi:hypothetical protein
MNKKVKKRRGGGPASPIVDDGEAPPWVSGHRVVELDEKNRIVGQRWSVSQRSQHSLFSSKHLHRYPHSSDSFQSFSRSAGPFRFVALFFFVYMISTPAQLSVFIYLNGSISYFTYPAAGANSGKTSEDPGKRHSTWS